MAEGSRSLLVSNQLSLPPVVLSPPRNDSKSRMLKLNSKLVIGQSNILLSPRQPLAPIRGSHLSRSRSPKMSAIDDPVGQGLRKASLVQAMTLNPSPHRRHKNSAAPQIDNAALNSDIMVLISKPRGVNKVDPLRL